LLEQYDTVHERSSRLRRGLLRKPGLQLLLGHFTQRVQVVVLGRLELGPLRGVAFAPLEDLLGLQVGPTADQAADDLVALELILRQVLGQQLEGFSWILRVADLGEPIGRRLG